MTDRDLMKQALEALEDADTYVHAADLEPAITALRERLAHCDRCGKRLGGEGDIHTCSPRPEQKPVAYLCENAVGHKYFRWKKPSSTYKLIALYIAPPQRKPLTEEQMEKIAAEYWLYPRKFVRAIEAAHGIKE